MDKALATVNLNQRTYALVEKLVADAERWRIAVRRAECGARLIDCGMDVEGGLGAGLCLARVCLSDLAKVELSANPNVAPWVQRVTVATDHPRLACMASQYAGWEVKGDGYYAMGSGPMRAAAVREPLFAQLGYSEQAVHCVGVLEAAQFPPDEICCDLADKCGVAPDQLTLLVAPTRSLAGCLQVVARSVETAMHKLHELGFELQRVVSGWGEAPLPPPAKNDLAAIGRTNDAILYGGRVVLYVRGDDASIEQIGPQTPSSASSDYGRPFAQVLAGYNHDFYRIDPLLFSPAQVTFANLDTGRSFRYGDVDYELVTASFGL